MLSHSIRFNAKAAFAVAFLLLLVGSGCSTAKPERDELAIMKQEQAAATPAGVLAAMQRGNERFASGKLARRDMLEDQRITAAGQYPSAAVLSCIDSRAPAEFVFDGGIGDFFNARVAGNVADTDVVGSLEFACKVSGAKLIVVMGHTSCGAIKGACDRVQLGNLTGLLEKIQPAVQTVAGVPGERNSKNHEFVEAVTEANVHLTVKRIRELSPILGEMESAGQIGIVGCIYNLENGRVRFVTPPPGVNKQEPAATSGLTSAAQ
jgi:carbonic anhydrase